MVDAIGSCESGVGGQSNTPAYFERVLRQCLIDIETRRHEINVELVADNIDQVQIAAQNEMNARQLSLNWQLATLIRAALERIKDGTFGGCLECGERISDKRLKFIPYAELCITCAKNKESKPKEKRWTLDGVEIPKGGEE